MKSKKIISIIAACAMLVTLLPASAFAADKTVFKEFKDSARSATEYPGDAGLRATACDKDGNVWFATKGSGLVMKEKGTDTYTRWNEATEPALMTSTVMAADIDESIPGEKTVYIAQGVYPEPDGSGSAFGEGMAGQENYGVAYLKDGKIDYLKVDCKGEPKKGMTWDGLPSAYVQDVRVDDQGMVWIGTEFGLTKYDPKKDTYQTWTMLDGFPAWSLDNIDLDGKGGVWCGFYPIADEDGNYTDRNLQTYGGFAYFNDGEIISYELKSSWDDASQSWKLADTWVRDISLDLNGGAWIITAGTRQGKGGINKDKVITGDGGYLFYVKEPGAKAVKFRGFDYFKKNLKLGNPGDIRMVTFDRKGGMWIGTSYNGILFIKDPDPVKEKFNVTAQFSYENGSWSWTNEVRNDKGKVTGYTSAFDNIAWLEFYDDVIYSGGYNFGMVYRHFDIDALYAAAECEKATVKLSSAKATKGKVKLSWKKAKDYNVDSYKIYRSAKKNSGFKLVKTIGSSKRSVAVSTKGLKKGKTYYYIVKGAAGKVDGITFYSEKSNVKGAKVK